MKKQKIKNEEGTFLMSSNNCEDDKCPVCLLMRECEEREREPTLEEIQEAMNLITTQK